MLIIHLNRVFNIHIVKSFIVCCAGGILVFLTGQAEVHSLCRRLRRAFPFRKDHTNTGEPLLLYLLTRCLNGL